MKLHIELRQIGQRLRALINQFTLASQTLETKSTVAQYHESNKIQDNSRSYRQERKVAILGKQL